ncbi:MAG: YaiI/YqxD family protein [Desulfotalea sp.]
MQIWVDADSCPVVIKEILFKAAKRTGIMITLVANRKVHIPRAENVKFILVGAGLDVADNEIAKQAEPGDIVITSDIPLAAEVVEAGCHAINNRGELYSLENIRERLGMRDFMDSLRSSGMDVGGPAKFNSKDKQLFAGSLDRLLSRYSKQN